MATNSMGLKLAKRPGMVGKKANPGAMNQIIRKAGSMSSKDLNSEVGIRGTQSIPACKRVKA